METIFPIILYSLGSMLLLVLIVVAFKLLTTFTKINVAIDNLNTKLSQLNSSFEIIDKTTSKFDKALDSVLGTVVNAVLSIFKKRGE